MPEAVGGEGLIEVRRRGNTVLARAVQHFSTGAVLAANAALVLDALQRAGIDHVVIDAETQRRRRVAVRERDALAVVAALTAAVDTAAPQAYWTDSGGAAAPVQLAALGPRADETILRVFEFYATPAGEVLASADLACDVELWPTLTEAAPTQRYGEPLEPGTLLAPRPNRWTQHLCEADLAAPGYSSVDGVQRAALGARGPHQLDVTFPIDAVYTWVDGTDPAWLAAKEQALGEGAAPHEFAALSSRFAAHEDLRYSLRSLENFADWVRRVYLVTDGQLPAWLNTADPRVRVVSHAELFDGRGVLPTFNSHAIESQLHHLPGLAEHYLYLNDDVFFGRRVRPDQFFHSNGIARFFPSSAKLGLGPVGDHDMPGAGAAKNSRDLIAATFGTVVTQKSRHAPHPQRRSTLQELEARWPEVFAATAASQFRSNRDHSIVTSLHHNYGYATGRSLPAAIEYGYLDLADPRLETTLTRWLAERSMEVFCLNDSDSRVGDRPRQLEMVADFLARYYPLPSGFER